MSTGVSHVDNASLIGCDKNGSLPLSNYKETVRQIPIRGHPTTALTTTPHNCQGHQTRGKSEKLSQPRGASGDMTTKCGVMSWMGSWN